jgi:hypothetical protein
MVVVTTRIRDPRVWGTRVTLRELKPLDDEAGAEVLRDLAPGVADPGGQEAHDLSRRLGGLPLALHLAGAYLGSPFARWSTFAGYREALDGVELPAALTDIEEQGADIHATVQRTWDLSLDALAAEGRPQARRPAGPVPHRADRHRQQRQPGRRSCRRRAPRGGRREPHPAGHQRRRRARGRAGDRGGAARGGHE